MTKKFLTRRKGISIWDELIRSCIPVPSSSIPLLINGHDVQYSGSFDFPTFSKFSVPMSSIFCSIVPLSQKIDGREQESYSILCASYKSKSEAKVQHRMVKSKKVGLKRFFEAAVECPNYFVRIERNHKEWNYNCLTSWCCYRLGSWDSTVLEYHISNALDVKRRCCTIALNSKLSTFTLLMQGYVSFNVHTAVM